MLDYRYETFLILCETHSYTKTAQRLFVTQPTVTQHIQYLEHRYQTRLFEYKNKQLILTAKGRELYEYTLQLKHNADQAERAMFAPAEKRPLRIGATKTIGEFVMPSVLAKYLDEYPDTDIDLFVDSTRVLLNKLHNNQIDVALLEGFFDKNSYDYCLLRLEHFIGICSPKSHLANKPVHFSDLLDERIAVREDGSGNREIIERLLEQYSLKMNDFRHICRISNFAAIKTLVEKNEAIAFVYEPVVHEELRSGALVPLCLPDDIRREFNFVMPKQSIFAPRYLDFFDFCQKTLEAQSHYFSK